MKRHPELFCIMNSEVADLLLSLAGGNVESHPGQKHDIIAVQETKTQDNTTTFNSKTSTTVTQVTNAFNKQFTNTKPYSMQYKQKSKQTL